MLFTIGNIITLLIVLVILVIFRQLDRNNRSIDKVRRYGQKVKDELNGFVDEKTQEVKNVAIELDVHQKTGKEILKRISSIEGKLNERSEDLEGVHERIVEYDTVLDELIDMTAKVEENLKRLQTESEFVDSVGRRLKESSARMGRIEKAIPSLRDEFAKENEKALKELSGEVIRRVKARAMKIEEDVKHSETRVKDFAEYLDGLEVRRDSLETETMRRIDSGIEDRLQRAEDSNSRIFREFEEGVADLLQRSTEAETRLSEELDRRVAELDDAVERTDVTIAGKLEDFQDNADDIERKYQQVLNDAATRGTELEDEIFLSLKEHVETRARETGKELFASLAKTREEIEASKEELVNTFGETRSELTIWQANLQKQMDEQVGRFEIDFKAFEGDIRTRMSETNQLIENTDEEQSARLERLKEELTSRSDELQESQGRRLSALQEFIEEKEDELKTILDERESQITEKVRQAEERNKTLTESVMSKLDQDLATFEKNVTVKFGEMEEQVTDYEDSLSYRYTKIEEIGEDLGHLEENLRSLMATEIEKIEVSFKEFAEGMKQVYVDEESQTGKRFDTLKAEMAGLEHGLEELKQKAYDNVSEKLQVFEDDFFSDLRSRNQGMQERLDEWRREIESRLATMGEEQAGERDTVEKEYSEELRERISELQNRTYLQYEKFEDQVTSFQDRINERIVHVEQSMDGFEETMRSDISEAKTSAKAMFESEFTEHTTLLGTLMKKQERDVENEIGVLRESVATARKDALAVLESAGSDVVVWQNKVLQQMKEAEGDLTNRLTNFKSETLENITVINEDFTSQREDLILSTQEERSRLKNELKEIAEKVVTLEADLRSRTENALETFNHDYETFMLDFQKRSREIQAEMDLKIRDFRSGSQDVKDKLDQIQAKLYAKVEEDTKALSLTLQEIDKKQKNFISQTKIFDRADALKIGLQESIEDLKAEVLRVETQSKEIRDADRRFQKIKKLGEEVSTKLSRFLAEKRRIEEMEGDFKKLINISQAVDVKLDQVTATHDTLQSIQARIRQLEEAEKAVQQKYERLERKDDVLDATATGVDKNFESLQALERDLRGLREEASALPGQLSELEERITILGKDKDRVESAVVQLESLETILSEVEDRMDSMQQAREWLGRTETRLGEVSKQAEEQVKLLGTLVKEDAGFRSKERGAPSMDSRELVRRLAHQGWSVQQIASQTKLSQGEVELILELLPK